MMLQENTLEALTENSNSAYVSKEKTAIQPTLEHLFLNTLHTEYETLYVLLYDYKGRIVEILEIDNSKDNVNKNTVHAPLDLIQRLKKEFDFTRIAFAHNHPSQSPHPSFNDLEFTTVFNEICKNEKVELIDHYIWTNDFIFSFKESGLVL